MGELHLQLPTTDLHLEFGTETFFLSLKIFSSDPVISGEKLYAQLVFLFSQTRPIDKIHRREMRVTSLGSPSNFDFFFIFVVFSEELSWFKFFVNNDVI